MALPRAASAAAGSDYPVQRHWFGYAFEFVAAALLSHEQSGDLPLHPRRDHDRTRLGQRLRPRRDVRHVAENLARRVDHHWPAVDRDARRERGPTAALVLAVQLGERALDR